MKLDYRCRGIGCTQATRCRRFLTGDAAKRSTIPVAALDMRRTTEACQSFLPRQDATVREE